MTTTTRRITVLAVFALALIAALLVSLPGKTTPKAEAAGPTCHAPILVWPMLSQFPAIRVTPMGSDWIDIAHRPSGGVRTTGLFEVNITLEYHWCLAGRHPKTTGLVQPYRTQICTMFTGFRPTGVRGVHWRQQSVNFPTLTSGARTFSSLPETVLKINTGGSMKGHWQCQARAVSSPWVRLSSHPQWRGFGYVDKANAKDWKFSMKNGGSQWRPFTPGTDQHRILFRQMVR